MVSAPTKTKPNLLVVMSDQHSLNVLGCAGDSRVRTPVLDTLAAGGVRFERTYCAGPLCVPSRMTFLTSLDCSDLQIWSNNAVLPSDVPTFAHSLGAAGYHTALCGRMHFYLGDHFHGFEEHLAGDVTGQWPGTGQSILGPIPKTTVNQARPAVEIAGPGRTAYQEFDRTVTREACAFLRRHAQARAAAGRPFCLVVGYFLPHCPLICPNELFTEYYNKMDVPRMSATERAGLHPAMQAWLKHHGLVPPLPDEVVRTARAAYYGLVTMLDGLIGELLAVLRDCGLADDTAVFYTSDHGEMAGRHELWWKNSFYEDSAGVPLIASWPGHFKANTVIPGPVSLLDIAPTLLKLGSAPPLPRMRGRSLTGSLAGQTQPPRDVFSELHDMRGDLAARMLVRWPWKLVHYHRYETPQLFNLQDDPGEINDRAGDPACADVQRDLHAAVRAGWDGQKVIDAYRLELERNAILAGWGRAVHPKPTGCWTPPEGCNVFPE